MKNRYLRYLIILFVSTNSIQVQAQVDFLRKQREETISKFSRAVGGTPLRIPLIFESDKSWSMLLVSDDSVKLGVDRVFLVDGTREDGDFNFNSDIYLVDSIKVIQEEIGCEYYAVVRCIKNDNRKIVPIDGYDYHIICRKINIDKYEDYPSRIKIPCEIIPLK